MCRQIQYVFTHCSHQGLNCFGNMQPMTVELCEAAAARGNPPYPTGYHAHGLPICSNTIEFRYVDSTCSDHYEPQIDENGYWDRYDPWAPENNQFHSATPAEDENEDEEEDEADFTYHVPETPWTNPLFRAIDWNPPPRNVPIEPQLHSPKDQTPIAPHEAGVLDAYYDPEHWQSADGRPIQLLETPDDPPARVLARPPNPEVPEDLDEQVDELIRQSSSESDDADPGLPDYETEEEEDEEEDDENDDDDDEPPTTFNRAGSGWMAPPNSPPGWEPQSPTARPSNKRAREDDDDDNDGAPPNKRARLDQDAADGEEPEASGPLLSLATSATRPKLTLKISAPPKPKLTLKISAPKPKLTLKLSVPAKPKVTLKFKLPAKPTTATRISRRRPTQTQRTDGPMTRNRLRQLQAKASQPAHMTRSRLAQLRGQANQPGAGNAAKMEQLETFLRYANGVER
ncbi:hypothetical protein ABEF95_006109 [Exophiala dermatitidis]